ncbi:hypothetical protein [Agromyces aureus]|uniref:Modulator of FtsH protease n=1 Tax=Agromyces aureus TaxID=453304 RepID=A0A191WDE0_9MICO|nr:hypothetical protein [Agromyces aureus]ANJ26242.1 hypothetical protein ATC03_05410 [Agromyces aureus]
MSEALEPWSEFNVAMVGATAALAGLLIVAMSVNISTILTSKTLPARAAASIATLVLAIAVTGLALVPAQPLWVYGTEVLVATAFAAAFEVHAVSTILRDDLHRGSRLDLAGKSAAGVLPIVTYLVGAMLLLVGFTSAGLLVIGIATIVAIASAILLAWVVLVEVLR